MTAAFMVLTIVWFVVAVGALMWGWGWRWVAREALQRLNESESRLEALQKLRSRAQVIRGMH